MCEVFLTIGEQVGYDNLNLASDMKKAVVVFLRMELFFPSVGTEKYIDLEPAGSDVPAVGAICPDHIITVG